MILLLALLVAQAGAAGPIKVAPHGLADSQQGTFLQAGPQATLRTIESRMRDVVNVKDFGAPCNDIGDDVPAFTAAINSLPASGGLIDATACSGMTIGSTWTIAKSGVEIRLPSANTITMGSNQIVISPGTHNVALKGTAPFGATSLSHTTAFGTFLSYTGTTVAIKVGDSTADTYGFQFTDATLYLETAGTAAIAVQLNRAIQYEISRVRLHMYPSGVNTQRGLDLQGFLSFTGGRVNDTYIWNGNIGIYFGQNANSSTIVGGFMVNNNAGTNTCYYFAGGAAASGNADGNSVFGGDCEQQNVLFFDFGWRNQVFGLRSESGTQLVSATVNSSLNTVFSAGSVNAVSDLGVNNSFLASNNHVFGQTLFKLNNATDTEADIIIRSGTTASQNALFKLNNHTDVGQWYFGKDSSENFILRRFSDSKNRLVFTQTGGSSLDAANGSAVQINCAASQGTALQVCNGAASPAVLWATNSTGISNDGLGFKHKRVAVGCTTAAAIGANCTSAALAWTTAFADASYTIVCTLTNPTGQPHISSVAQIAASFTVTIAADTAVGATATVDCIGIHD